MVATATIIIIYYYYYYYYFYMPQVIKISVVKKIKKS